MAPQASCQHSSTPKCSLLEDTAEVAGDQKSWWPLSLGLCHRLHLLTPSLERDGFSSASLMQELGSFPSFWGFFLGLVEETPCHRTPQGKGGLGASLGEVSLLLRGVKEVRQFPATQGVPGGVRKFWKRVPLC